MSEKHVFGLEHLYINFFFRLHELDRAWATLAKFMHDFVDSRRQDLANDRETFMQRGDLFTRLVEAYDGDGKLGLEEQEVVCNIIAVGQQHNNIISRSEIPLLSCLQGTVSTFSPLIPQHAFAYHTTETTACGLNATLGFLAIHQEEQEKSYQEILRTLPNNENPVSLAVQSQIF